MSYSFILTMRNLNGDCIVVSSLDRFGFYINYEKFKLNQFLALIIPCQSFILTMRNLNLDKLRADLEGEISFILTMRNLNNNSMSYNPLNLIGFILTMRNLNRVINDICEKFQVVLY